MGNPCKNARWGPHSRGTVRTVQYQKALCALNRRLYMDLKSITGMSRGGIADEELLVTQNMANSSADMGHGT
jgi:hypothetical protein